MTILDEILRNKRRELADAKRRVPPRQLEEAARAASEPLRGFRSALSEREPPRIVAEIKRCSPSRGELRADFDPVGLAKAYADAGACALSVLTDAHYFGGRLEYLGLVRREVELPLLRKDFVVDPYQIDEARVSGADAVLLIASALDREQLAALRQRASALGLDTLVEVHDDSELGAALEAGADLVGINNRDLRSFEVDLGITEQLAARIPDGIVRVAESGVWSAEDVRRLERAGVHACLVGEALMREQDVGLALRRLRGRS